MTLPHDLPDTWEPFADGYEAGRLSMQTIVGMAILFGMILGGAVVLAFQAWVG